jgi:hypothetical protein
MIRDLISRLRGDEDKYSTVDEIPEDRLKATLNILDRYGEERTSENILETAHRLADLQSLDRDDIRVGPIQDGVERRRATQRVLAPHIDEEEQYLIRNGRYSQTVMISEMPKTISIGYLHELITANVQVRISKHIEPRSTDDVRSALQRQQTRVRAKLAKKYEKNRTDTTQEKQKEETIEGLLSSIASGETKLFDASVYIEVLSDTEEELDKAVRQVIRTLTKRELDVDDLDSRQLEGMRSAAPIGKDEILGSSLQHAETLATSFGFIEPAFYQPSGTFYGFDETGVPIYIDRFSLHGYSKAVSGALGGGKTFSVLADSLGMMEVNPEMEAIFFDPLGDDFPHLTKELGGQVIEFGGEYRINPLEISEDIHGVTNDPYQDKIRSLNNLMDIHFDEKNGITAQHRGVLTRVWHLAFLKFGITADKSTHGNPSPDFSTVLDILQNLADGESVTEFFDFEDHVQSPDTYRDAVQSIAERMSSDDAALARELLRALEEFQPDGTCSNLNGQTNVDLNSRIVTVDMSSFADSGAMPLIMHVMLDWSYQRARSRPNPMEVVFEEVHYLLNYEGARNLMNLFFRHGRHFNTGLTLISQTVREFVRDEEVRDMYDQCPIKKVFYLENLEQEVIDYFDLTKPEQKFIQNAKKGDEHGISNALLSVSGMGKRQLTIEFGEFKEHVLDDDLDPWDYLIEYGDITPEDVEWLAENDRLVEYRDDIPQEVLEAASV